MIQAGVNVSANVHGGSYVYLAPGAKINENLTIADHVIVGSNCVVTHSVEYEGSETISAAFFSSPGAERQKGGQNAYTEKGQRTGRTSLYCGLYAYLRCQ